MTIAPFYQSVTQLSEPQSELIPAAQATKETVAIVAALLFVIALAQPATAPQTRISRTRCIERVPLCHDTTSTNAVVVAVVVVDRVSSRPKAVASATSASSQPAP